MYCDISKKRFRKYLHAYCKQYISGFINAKEDHEPKMFQIFFFISVTVRHKNVQSNVPVGHIMISLNC